ncbi:MAG TPA: single-stranded DNA-binding protein [Dissulfurispiraceae bacterium]|nr:single-stranded DNA-binding protein [Dissulfurispiraceae bacterium]
MAINQVQIEGNLGRDPDYRFSKGDGKPMLSFSIAVNQSYKVGNEWIDKPPVWLDVVLFGDAASKHADSFRKGDKVLVLGKLSRREWTDREGILHDQLQIIATDVYSAKRGSFTSEPALSEPQSDTLADEFDLDSLGPAIDMDSPLEMN